MYDKKMYQETFSALGASENTLLEVRHMTKENKRKPHRISRTALVAAIIILMLGMATVAMAYSGAGNWFLGFSRERSGGDLTTGQQQLIENETVNIGKSVSYDDITVTVESALSDDYNAFIKLKVEAPEGIDFGAENYHFRSSHIDIEFRSMGAQSHTVHYDEGEPNVIRMLYEPSFIPFPDSGATFRDGNVRTITFTDLCTWEDGVGSVVFVEGTWSFDIVLSDIGSDDSIIRFIEFLTEPVYCNGRGLMGDYQEVLLISFRLDSFGAVITYEQSPDANPEALDFKGVQIVMKDGSIMELMPQSGIVGVFTLSLAAPVVLGDVDYVQFPEGILLPMPIS